MQQGNNKEENDIIKWKHLREQEENSIFRKEGAV